jgi:DNA-binding GntR family transcriptional regulator
MRATNAPPDTSTLEAAMDHDEANLPTPTTSHGEMVYRSLRTALIDQAIEPGARILETEIAERLQVSRTPVREALRRLESDGFVQRIGRSRLVATPAGPDDLGDIGLLRVEIDGLAAQLAARRATAREWNELGRLVEEIGALQDVRDIQTAHAAFHRAVYAIGFGPRMSIFVDNHIVPFIEATVNPGASSLNAQMTSRNHQKLLAALSSGDTERAVVAARQHAESGLSTARSSRA